MKKGKAVLFWMLGVAFMVTEALAVPACPEPFEVTQSDGTKVLLRKCGDEFLKWYEDAEGFTVMKDEKSKNWFYAELSADASKLVPSKVLVGSPTNARPSARRILPQRTVESSRAKRSAQRQQSIISERGIGTSGTVRQLVILVQFSDQKFVHTLQQFDDLFNKIGYNGMATRVPSETTTRRSPTIRSTCSRRLSGRFRCQKTMPTTARTTRMAVT